MPLQTIELHPAEPATASIIVLHGLGADGTDFLSLGDELRLGPVGPVRFVMPRAPVRPVTINGGYRMRAWYSSPISCAVRTLPGCANPPRSCSSSSTVKSRAACPRTASCWPASRKAAPSR
jgi:Phospholipase/Carboxylesterase